MEDGTGMVDGDGDGTGQRPAGDPALPPEPPQPPPRQPTAAGQPPPVQPGARPPQGAGQAHRTSVLRHPTITVEPASQQAAPGVTTEVVLAIVNNSDTVSDFAVELDDRSVGWIRIEPATKNLWPGSRDVFRVLVTPPRSAEVRAGIKQYGLTITSSGIPGGTANTSIQIDVLPFQEVEPRLVPRTSSGYFRGRHRLEVRNLGSAPWTASVTASDPEEALRITVPEPFAVGPGDTAVVGVTVRSKAWNIIGSTLPHPFTVELAGGDGTRQRLDGNHNQRAVIPGRLVVPLLAAAALVVVGGLWAFGVIPPGGGATGTASPPPPPPTATVAPSEPAPSASTETPSSETPSASTEAPSASTETPSSSAAVKPDGVDQWAWDRYQRLLTQGAPFDVGKTIGPTADTTDGKYRVQWFDLAVMYRLKPVEDPNNPTLVVRPPIFATFPLKPISPDPPGIGYPTDSRQGDRTGRTYQVFELATILCLDDDVTCFTHPNQVFDLWQDHADELGSPLDNGSPQDPYTIYQFEQGRIVYDGGEGRAACDQNNFFLGGSSPDLCSV